MSPDSQVKQRPADAAGATWEAGFRRAHERPPASVRAADRRPKQIVRDTTARRTGIAGIAPRTGSQQAAGEAREPAALRVKKPRGR